MTWWTQTFAHRGLVQLELDAGTPRPTVGTAADRYGYRGIITGVTTDRATGRDVVTIQLDPLTC